MLKILERVHGNVNVEIDAPQGRILLVSCPTHGGMSLRLSNPAWVCPTCGTEFTKLEAQQLIDVCYAEIRQQDRDTAKQDAAKADARLQAKFAHTRKE